LLDGFDRHFGHNSLSLMVETTIMISLEKRRLSLGGYALAAFSSPAYTSTRV
jgi:hypothetical protein